MESDDSLEVWTSDLRFLFAMGPILQATSYSLEELATLSWASLFEREKPLATRIIADVLEALVKSKSPI